MRQKLELLILRVYKYHNYVIYVKGNSINNPLIVKYILLLYGIHSCNGLYLAKNGLPIELVLYQNVNKAIITISPYPTNISIRKEIIPRLPIKTINENNINTYVERFDY